MFENRQARRVDPPFVAGTRHRLCRPWPPLPLLAAAGPEAARLSPPANGPNPALVRLLHCSIGTAPLKVNDGQGRDDANCSIVRLVLHLLKVNDS